MNISFLQRVGGPTVQKAILKLSKYAPEILTGVGVVGFVGSTILIARASTKLEEVVTKHEQAIEMNREHQELARVEETMFTEEEVKKDLVRIYARTGLDLVKLYGPGVSLGIGSIISVLAAHGIMHRRAVVLMGAYKAVESSFAAYRQRVVDEFGEEKDRDFALGFKTEKVIDEETGKKTTVRSVDPNHVSRYARWFDEGNPNWVEDPMYNLAFLKAQQNWFNDKLRIRGFVFLHEVYEALGFETTKEAQIVGWVMDPNGGGDLHIDFNIYTADSVKARDFVNGIENSVLLDFNVDGVILDKI